MKGSSTSPKVDKNAVATNTDAIEKKIKDIQETIKNMNNKFQSEIDRM